MHEFDALIEPFSILFHPSLSIKENENFCDGSASSSKDDDTFQFEINEMLSDMAGRFRFWGKSNLAHEEEFKIRRERRRGKRSLEDDSSAERSSRLIEQLDGNVLLIQIRL